MSEFSYEFIKKMNWGDSFDFSITDIYNNLREGEAYNVICEGFGFTKIMKSNNQCLLWFPRKECYINFNDLLSMDLNDLNTVNFS